MVEDEKFFAWLDGELSAEEAARVGAEIAGDPELSRKAEMHRAMSAGLRSAFGTVAASPMSERISAAVRASEAKVVDLAAVREERLGRRSFRIWGQTAALAATLAVGVFTGNMLPRGQASPIRPEGGRLVAGGELENALYTQLASAPADGPRIGMTYRDKAGAICRTFQDEGSSGLACREGGDWRIRGLFQGAEGQSSDYRMASGINPRLMDMVDESIAGEPFDANQEKAAQSQDWR